MVYLLEIFQLLVYTGFGLLTLQTYFHLFLTPNKSRISQILCWVPFILWQCIWNILSRYGIRTPFLTNSILSLMTITGAGLLGYQESFRKSFIFSVSYFFLMLASEEIVWYSLQALGLGPAGKSAWWPPVLARLINAGLILLLYTMLHAKQMASSDEKETRHLLLFSACNMCVVYAIVASCENPSNSIRQESAAFSILVLFLSTLYVYRISWKIWDNMELRRQNEMYGYQINVWKNHQRELETKSMETRRVRHDLKQKLIYLHELAVQHDTDTLCHVIEQELNEYEKNLKPAVYTGNSAIDAVLNDKYKHAESCQIPVSFQLDIPAGLPFNDCDLCVLLGNLLDNACEASAYMPQQQRFVKVWLLFRLGTLRIQITNSFDGFLERRRDGSFHSRKKQDPSQHGFGLQSVRQIVKRYQGDISISTQDLVFTVDILLYPQENIHSPETK